MKIGTNYVGLKERCISCGGSGVYTKLHTEAVCWSCDGKGWLQGALRKPDAAMIARLRKAAEAGS